MPTQNLYVKKYRTKTFARTSSCHSFDQKSILRPIRTGGWGERAPAPNTVTKIDLLPMENDTEKIENSKKLQTS